MIPRIIEAAKTPSQAWKNGGGITRELLCLPNNEHWKLRISVADITQDGAFSAFAGVTRYFTVLAGEGVMLGTPAQRITSDMQPIRFDGADAPMCTLIAGATRDLNVMVRAGGAISSIKMQTLRAKRIEAITINTQANFSALFCMNECDLHVGDRHFLIPSMSLVVIPVAQIRSKIEVISSATDRRVFWICAFVDIDE